MGETMLNLDDRVALPDNHVIPINNTLAQFLAKTMHNLIKKTAHSDVVVEINNTIDAYLSKEFSTLKVNLPNKKDSFLYLSKNFEVITSVLEVCKNARITFPDAELILYYDEGADEEENTSPSLILYIKQDDMSKEIRQMIRDLTEPYEDIFATYEAFFHTEPYLKNYV